MRGGLTGMGLYLWTLLGIFSGACIAVQAPINAALGRGLGLPVAAAAISFASGLVALCVVSVVMARTQGLNLNWSAPAPWLFVAGGLLGAIYVTSTILLTPQVGAAAVMALAITGQLLAGMLLDRFGFLGMEVREFSPGRLLGALLLVGGALMIRFL